MNFESPTNLSKMLKLWPIYQNQIFKLVINELLVNRTSNMENLEKTKIKHVRPITALTVNFKFMLTSQIIWVILPLSKNSLILIEISWGSKVPWEMEAFTTRDNLMMVHIMHHCGQKMSKPKKFLNDYLYSPI